MHGHFKKGVERVVQEYIQKIYIYILKRNFMVKKYIVYYV